MAVETYKARTARLMLENGTDDEGNMKYVNTSLGALSSVQADWDGDKALGITTALAPCLNKTVGYVETTVTSSLSAS